VHDAQRVADARDLGGLALREVAAVDGDDAAVVHDLDLAPHLVHVLRGEQLALGDGAPVASSVVPNCPCPSG
jgi:hypothetical protein